LPASGRRAGALARAGGNQTRAAHLLGLTPRSVYNKMRKHRLAG
jgi:DNA-binding protein Fis